ncbi:hypothetical protein ACHAWT_000835 [Skeletonema menzelii]
MDVAAAIRAQTNQMELQRKKKQLQQQQTAQTAEFHNKQSANPRSSSGGYPQKSRSFHDERNQFNPYALQQQQQDGGKFPHYVNSEYQFENKDIDCEDADSITSSLSGTLPGTIVDSHHHPTAGNTASLQHQQHQLSPRRELQKLDMLKATVKAELDELRSTNYSDSTKHQQNITSKSLPPPYRATGGIVNLSENDLNTNNNSSAAKSVGSYRVQDDNVVNIHSSSASVGTRERITPGGNIIVMENDNDNAGGNANNNNGQGHTLGAARNQSNTTTPTKTNRIQEIMSAYQGKVESILNKRGEEHSSFQTLIEKNQYHRDTTTANSSSAALAAAPAGGGHGNTSLGASLTSTSSTPNSGIENILDTYKKKVDEIMNTPTKPMPSSVTMSSSSSSVASYGKQPTLAVNFDRIEDDEEEESFDNREGALDNDDRYIRSNSGGGVSSNKGDDEDDDDDRSYDDSRGSYSSRSSGGSGSSSRSSYDSRSQSSRSNSPPQSSSSVLQKQQSFSERANAILNSINSPNSSGEAAAGGGGGRSPLQKPSNSEEGSNDDDNSHISGASSASEKSGLASLRSQDRKLGSKTTTTQQAAKVTSSPQLPFKRKDSLSRAQEITGLSPQKSKSLHRDGPTTASTTRSDIEEERLYRMELERRLAEATQREDELTRENRRLEKNLSEVQSQLDEVNSAARSNKYSSSEQTSKIRELERKLKHEKERSEELERERDAIKEEYDQDLEEQKDINRQLEQMVMSEEFEKELEDEINQVKELEHANRRFKVKVDMLEREKNAIMKRYDGKMEDSANKIKSLEEQLKEWEGKVGGLETTNRETEKKWEDKLEEEKRYARDLRFDLEKAEDKIKVLEAELVELRDSNSKIEEYEQVLGKLMERNEELEEEAHTVMGEKEMMDRQVELETKRYALKVKELEEKIEEQQVYIEQQQETLDESVKTILKMYSLNNGQGDDMSQMSEEQLTGIARSIVPRASGRQALPTVRDDIPSISAGGFVRRRDTATTSGRSRMTDDVETLMLESESRVRARSRGRGHQQLGETDIDRPVVRARSRGRPAPRPEDDFDDMRARARSKSRGRGDRTESMRQLTERARTPGRNRSRSPGGYRRDRDYDPSGPVSDSRALVLATPPNDSGRKYGGQYDVPQSSGSRQNSRREGSGSGGKYDNYDGPPRHEGPRSGGGRPDRHAQRRAYHEDGYRGSSNPRRGDRGEGDDRRRSGGGGDHYGRKGSGGDYSDSRGYRNKNYSHNDDHYTPRRVPREPSIADDEGQDRQLRLMSDGDDGRQRSGSGNRRRSSRRYHPRDRDRD